LRGDYFQIPYDPDTNDFENQHSTIRAACAMVSMRRMAWRRSRGCIRSVHRRCCRFRRFITTTGRIIESNPNDAGGNDGGSVVELRGSAGFDYDGDSAEYFQAGFYSFGQHDNYVFGAIFNDGSGKRRSRNRMLRVRRRG
jgi:hypothetical protein